MSLIRQIILLVLATVVLAFAGSVAVSIVVTRDTMQTQLRLKNSDNAAALALALSQQQGDPALMDLLMSAQFDTGFYRSIRFAGADGKPVFVREAVPQPGTAPDWFVSLVAVESVPGLAQVSDGWRALGSVQVVSQSGYAHDDLWRASLSVAAALAVVGALAGLAALALVRRIRQPLDRAVAQAQSLVEGEFVTVDEPRVAELGRLTRAMNSMVKRLKVILEAQAQQVESLRRQANCDPLTGLSNRKYFLGQLEATLQREDGAAEGGLVFLRVIDLAGVNRLIGHAATDRMIEAIAQALQAYTERVHGCYVGRLNGSDFALCLPVGGLALETAQSLSDALKVMLPAFGPGIAVAAGAVEMHRERQVAAMLSAADAALALAESRGAYAVELGNGVAASHVLMGEAAWRQGIGDALLEDRARLVSFPLLDANRELIHLECPLRLQLHPQGPFESAARWLPLALRARLTPAIDERAMRLALKASTDDGLPRCVNLSASSLADSSFSARLRRLMQEFPEAARLLSVEVPDVATDVNIEWLRELARQLRAGGVRFGLEHVGDRLAQIDRLFELGLDYVKLDISVVRGVAQDIDRASYIRSVVVMLRGLSIKVYAEGVFDADDCATLWTLGLDGVTGPWASAARSDLVR